jgi:hypothetical protein
MMKKTMLFYFWQNWVGIQNFTSQNFTENDRLNKKVVANPNSEEFIIIFFAIFVPDLVDLIQTLTKLIS